MSVKQKCPEFENHERWLVSYADMVTLLFAVFVVLYSLNLTASKADKSVAGSLQESFNTPLPDIPVDRRVGPTEQGFGIFDHFKGQSVRPSLIQKYPSSTQRTKIIEDQMHRIKANLEERLYGPNKYRPDKPGSERTIQVQRTAKGFKLQLLARHFYEPGAVNVSRGALKDLDEVAIALKELGRPVRIEGHTDSVPAPGELGNWEISALRATNIIKYLIRRHSFPATSLSAAGLADLHPIASNGTEAGRQLNRRIEIHVDYDAETSGTPQ